MCPASRCRAHSRACTSGMSRARRRGTRNPAIAAQRIPRSTNVFSIASKKSTFWPDDAAVRANPPPPCPARVLWAAGEHMTPLAERRGSQTRSRTQWLSEVRQHRASASSVAVCGHARRRRVRHHALLRAEASPGACLAADGQIQRQVATELAQLQRGRPTPAHAHPPRGVGPSSCGCDERRQNIHITQTTGYRRTS